MEKNKKDYYLGLDLGTNSVGWAVTDENYNLLKFRKKDMWGIRLFDEANTAAERRSFRAARRRLDRKKNRIKLLQELFSEEIAKVDPAFFIKLNESKLHIEDKTVKQRHPLFCDEAYTDIDYYKQYPTIFHLRKELIESKEPHDVRLVYLALHHILKNRGHFLIPGALNDAKSFSVAFNNMLQTVKENLELDFEVLGENYVEFESILKDKLIRKSEKEKKLFSLVRYSSEGKSKDEKSDIEKSIKHIIKLMIGLKGDISKISGIDADEIEKPSFAFSDSSFDDITYPELEEKLQEKIAVIDSIKAVYDWMVLVDILAEEEYLSCAKVKAYEQHKDNLYILRGFVMKYLKGEEYKKFFNSFSKNTNAYSNYIGTVKKNGRKYAANRCSEEDFYKEVKKLLEKITPSDDDREMYDFLYSEAERKTLLPLQRSKSNSVIPKQVHEAELSAILNNASNYLDFLQEQDESGITTAEKIHTIFDFRVPYYVGPLSKKHVDQGANAWIERKKEGRIYPWNFDAMVDLEKSNERFIRRMTNKCTYLIGEDVIPKQSLLYSKFMVLNELNNLKIKSQPVTEELKQRIYQELFECKANVKSKELLLLLRQELCMSELQLSDLSGFDVETNFKSNLKPLLDMRKLFGSQSLSYEQTCIAEDIIKYLTIYGKDKKMVKNTISAMYPGKLTKEQLKGIDKLSYSGWGNFSEKFLNGITGTDRDSGKTYTIIQALWETNKNLMQLLSRDFTFTEERETFNAEVSGSITDFSYDNLIKDLYVSPANKRIIWQAVQIARELEGIMGCAPAKIFVEMARGPEEKKRTISRKARLLELYKACGADLKSWADEIERIEESKFNNIKLYLYYTQMGKCLYTGESIDLEQLLAGNSRWDRDHIYPQSKIKDDSLDNLVLVNKVANSKKDNEFLSSEVQAKMQPYWKVLLEKGLISKKKYDRLTRKGDFTDEELAGFIARQLVETRQSSKAAAELLGRIYPAPDTKIVYVKAGLVSQFRKNDLGILKSRRVNDYHHAKDAYLNIVVGNVYDTKFTSNPVRWMRDNRDTNYSLNQIFNYDVIDRQGVIVWEAPEKDDKNKLKLQDGLSHGGSIDTVRKTIRQNNILYTEITYCENGQLFDATIYKKGDPSIKVLLKKSLDSRKYGGYKSPGTSYFAMIEFDVKKGERARQIVGVPIYIANMLSYNLGAFAEYCQTVKGLKNVTVLHPMIKKNSLLVVDGFPMRIRGENDANIMLKSNMQLRVCEKMVDVIRKVEKLLSKEPGEIDDKYIKVDENELIDLYDELTAKLGSVYAKRPGNKSNELLLGRKLFTDLSLIDKAKVTNEILTMLRCDHKTDSDLRLVGGAGKAGQIAVNKNTIGKSDLILVNQSVTGLFENRITL